MAARRVASPDVLHYFAQDALVSVDPDQACADVLLVTLTKVEQYSDLELRT